MWKIMVFSFSVVTGGLQGAPVSFRLVVVTMGQAAF
jgi:hypothetical protein